MPGPIPRREETLAEPRRPGREANRPSLTRGALLPVKIPTTPSHWHPIAKRLFNGLKDSGQRDFYQQSDWALAFSLCDDLSRYKQQEDRSDEMTRKRDEWFALSPEEREEQGLPDVPPPAGGKGGSAMKLTAMLNALSGLMVTEGDRRRLRVELTAPRAEEKPASVVAIDGYKARLAGGK